jgi:hypothetical protein
MGLEIVEKLSQASGIQQSKPFDNERLQQCSLCFSLQTSSLNEKIFSRLEKVGGLKAVERRQRRWQERYLFNRSN